MKQTIAAFVILLQFATLTALSVTAPSAQDGADCVGARQAQAAVESGEILDLPAAARRKGVATKFIGDEARLCTVDGEPHWVVNVMSAAGDSERLVLNALSN